VFVVLCRTICYTMIFMDLREIQHTKSIDAFNKNRKRGKKAKDIRQKMNEGREYHKAFHKESNDYVCNNMECVVLIELIKQGKREKARNTE